MKIFTSGTDRKPKWREADESMFAYFCRSDRDEVQVCRDTIEKWADEYPKNDLERWLGNFKSNDDSQHHSAFFELFLFKLFSVNGVKVLEIEPSFEGIAGTPDF